MQTNLQQQFLLDPDITFLNFGSFGACAKPVFEEWMRYQLELEREPVQFITVNGPQYLKASREALGSYIGCHADDVVYVPNPSHGVNVVAKNFNLKPGDEILSTNLEYGACDKTWDYYCTKAQARYVRQPITLPLTTKQKFIDDFFSGLSDRTRMVFISHITSTTGLILPVAEICAIARQKGLLTFVDGAHAPAHVDVNLQTLQADFYTGACHKWMMTPKGSSFLYVNKTQQPTLDPLIVSWGYKSMAPSHSRFLDYHQFNGTRDFSAYLTIPKAMEFMQQHNWKEVSAQCKKMVCDNAFRFCDLMDTPPLAPVTDEFIGQMLSIPVKTTQPEKLQRHLFEQYKIEIPVMRLDDKTFIRYSIQAYNKQHDLDKLFDALKEIKGKKGFIG